VVPPQYCGKRRGRHPSRFFKSGDGWSLGSCVPSGRFLIGPWSYAALTPGGLFSPLLLVGATFGAVFAAALNYVVPTLALSLVSFAVVGMVALFSATVRAPLTGVVLAVEMTGRGDLILAMLARGTRRHGCRHIAQIPAYL
jgi:H+/Cl- antiporter ClcA